MNPLGALRIDRAAQAFPLLVYVHLHVLLVGECLVPRQEQPQRLYQASLLFLE